MIFGGIMMIYPEFDDCGHLVEEALDYARELGIGANVVDAVFDHAYHDNRQIYKAITALPDHDTHLRQANVTVQKKVMSELERLAGRK